MKKILFFIFCLVFLLSAEVCMAEENFFSYRFADAKEAAEMLLSHREYYENLTQNDLNYRLQKQNGTLEELEDFITHQTRDFTDSEKKLVDGVMKWIADQCHKNGYTLPASDTLVFAKTSMYEEYGSAAYTHGNEIYLEEGFLDRSKLSFIPYFRDSFRRTIAHELFHCLTRNHPDFRKDMYAVLSFTVVGDDYAFPQEVRDIIISNPDVEHHNSYASFEINGQVTDCTVILTAKPFENRGEYFVDYMKPCLVPVDDFNTVYTAEDAANFWDVFGRNTDYVIDPEETLADNFALLFIKGPKAKYETPEIIADMDAYLRKH
jgi:hypothetical protein